MKKNLEDYLWVRIRNFRKDEQFLYPEFGSAREVIQHMIDLGMIQSKKQDWATLDKWDSKRIYEYGCCLDLGWRCDMGMEK